MEMNRREMLRWVGGACSALALRKFARSQQAAHGGPFEPTRESLQAYRIPDWFRDAKFGIWAHWGPQSAIEDGDWYARNMYMQGQPQYLYHCETYGHPSKVGYKDLVNHMEGCEVGSGSSDEPLQEGRREVLLQHGRASRQLRPVELEVPALERREHGAEEGCRGRCGKTPRASRDCGSE